MELKSAEQEVESLRGIYESLQRAVATYCTTTKFTNNDDKADSPFLLPPLGVQTSTTTTTAVGDTHGNGSSNSQQEVTMSPVEILAAMESMQERVTRLEPLTTKFRKRMKDKDPITDKPRYGEQTYNRVQQLLEMYDAMSTAVQIIFQPQQPQPDDKQITIHEWLRKEANAQLEEERNKEREEQERRQREEAARKAQEEEERLRKLKEQEAERLEQERVALELQRQAQEAREAERLARQAAARADSEWMNSIKKGPEGIQMQLDILLQSTANDRAAQLIAITALHTLFSQIVSHPEEPNFRRIRRDHVKFNQDIGRHAGGKELLIAAGFELGVVDEVPSFISKEPNIEKDMDGWAQWFEWNKKALALLEDALIRVS